MRIGLDFDNTIVSYDVLFHSLAVEKSLIPADVPVNKVAVRDHMREAGREDDWTELQGYLYGARMDEARAYDGVIEFCADARERGDDLFIVSHKTRHPFIGPQYDLHAAARAWIETHLTLDGRPLVKPEQVFFELTKPEKLARIDSCSCDVYVDDLPEILLAPAFPARTTRVLFDPERHHAAEMPPDVLSFSDWSEAYPLISRAKAFAT